MNATKSLLATAVFAVIGGSVAYAAQPTDGPLYDPAQLPSFKGRVTQYDLTPRGDVAGLILDGNTEVHFSPRQSTLLVATVKPGDMVTIHGLKARTIPMIKAMSITQDATGQSVVESHDGPRFGPGGPGFGGGREGGHFWPHWFGHGPAMPPHGAPPPPPPGGDATELSASGTVKLQLHGPRGELDGVLLDNGTEIHLPPPAAEQLGDALAVGKPVAVKGFGSKTILGTAIEARSLGASAATLKDIAPPPGLPGPGPHGDHH